MAQATNEASDGSTLPISQTKSWLIWSAAAVAFVTLLFYWFHFGGPVTDDHERWGTFGDFLGGTLNPVFGFITIVFLVFNLHAANQQLAISRRELALTREELKRSADAQNETAKALQKQADFSARSARITALSYSIQALDARLTYISPGMMSFTQFDPVQLVHQRDALVRELDQEIKSMTKAP